MRKFCILDYETRSEADLKKVGAYNYSLHPSTQILCAAWRVGTKEELRDAPIRCWSPAFRSAHYIDLLNQLSNGSVGLVAHNALFEQVITKHVLHKHIRGHGITVGQNIPISRWTCTAARASALALPRKLEQACHALGLSVQKDMEGHRLMLKLSKPRKPTKHNKAKWHCKTSDLKRVMDYCVTDIDAETELFLTIPALNPNERKVWELDQKINLNGFEIDYDLVKIVLRMIAEETRNLDAETKRITMGEVDTTNQLERVHGWLSKQGVSIPDLAAKTVRDAIDDGLVTGAPKRLLEIRQSVSRTSTKKYAAFNNRVGPDNRVRDILMYWAASTGRWGGTGVQPQNFPQGKLKYPEQAVEIIKDGDLELVRMIYGNPMEVFSSCLRSVIIAPKGKKLLCSDYSAIEAKVLFWLAKHDDGLKIYEEGRDPYRELAAIIFNVDLKDVTKEQREVGKRAVLGCGYGMGADKFAATCKQYGMEVSDELALRAVKAYRSTHYPVPILWSNIERAAIAAVQNKGTKYKVNRTAWFVQGKFLYCELPSGRRLAYYGPYIKFEPTPWDEKRPKLYHWGVDPYTKQWTASGTYGGKLTENVDQAVARDLMAEGMLRVDATGRYDIDLSVHDELLAESVDGTEKEFGELMDEIPAWAAGCPVKSKVWSGDRYKK